MLYSRASTALACLHRNALLPLNCSGDLDVALHGIEFTSRVLFIGLVLDQLNGRDRALEDVNSESMESSQFEELRTMRKTNRGYNLHCKALDKIITSRDTFCDRRPYRSLYRSCWVGGAPEPIVLVDCTRTGSFM